MAGRFDPQSSRRLVAFDDYVLDQLEKEVVQRIADQLAAVEDRVLVVESADGDGRPVRLSQTDYVVLNDGSAIIRQSDGERLSHWSDSGEADRTAAVRFLAKELMIPDSEIYYFATEVLPGLVESGAHIFLIGGDGESVAATVKPCDPAEVPGVLKQTLAASRSAAARTVIEEEAFERAIETLHRNVTDLGFTAASLSDNALMEHDSNYAAVWSRDGVITGLWTLCVDDSQLHSCFKDTLELVAANQVDSGQIPSYIRIKDQTPDFSGIGGIASIDSALWFVIGAVRYAFHMRDREFAKRMEPNLARAMDWLRAHDSNNDGLLELPESSDWMDLFPRSYNVLYDEVLWYQACHDYAVFIEALNGEDGSRWYALADHIAGRILDLFWPSGQQLVELAGSSSGRFSLGEARYLLSQVTPFDYSWRCDVFANLLAALTGILDASKQERLFTFLWGVGVNNPSPVACLYPPIQSGSDDWKDYFMVNFLNLPNHYHNGGIWPLVGGLWVRYLYNMGRVELAYRELTVLAESCRAGINQEWEFNEWLHGETGRPMGKARQAWSAASYVKAYLTVKKQTESAAFETLDASQIRDAD